jgi:hypothetical protein
MYLHKGQVFYPIKKQETFVFPKTIHYLFVMFDLYKN